MSAPLIGANDQVPEEAMPPSSDMKKPSTQGSTISGSLTDLEQHAVLKCVVQTIANYLHSVAVLEGS